MGPKGAKGYFSFLMIFIMLISIAGISPVPVAAAPPDLITVTVNLGDTLTTVLDTAAGGDRYTIASLKIITSGYSLSSSDFGVLKSMATGGTGRLTYLDLSETDCANNEIPNQAFDNHGNTVILSAIILPNSITRIGAEAFYLCSLTGGLTIPGSVTSIGSWAFYGCRGLTGGLTIPSGVASIGSSAFRDCSGFTGALIIPNSVTSIESHTFYGCSGFNGGLTIPNSVTNIGIGAFNGCSGFTGSLSIPSSVTSIARGAFYRCSGFNGDLTISNSASSIGDYAFAECSRLTGSLTIPNSVTSIGSGAFSDCQGFTGSLTIPDSVTSIGAYAFYNCARLTGLTIPNNVTSIADNTFYGCSGLTGSLTIPGSVTSIGAYAFCNCSGFTGSLIIPNSVTYIGGYAFYGCSGFTGSLTIPNSVTSIADNTFFLCTGFTGSLTIPGSVTSICGGAFYRCRGFNGNLTIPNSVTSIGDLAFADCSGFTGNLTIPSSITSIGWRAFALCNGFTGSLTIPGSVTSIGFQAFLGCSGFNGNLIISDSITSIDSLTFFACSGFTGALIIPNGVTSISESVFYGCNRFSSLTLPNSLTSIGNSAFSGCSGLTGALTLPNSVTSIGDSAFYNCSGFTGALTLPNSVTSIGSSAFYNLQVDSVTYHGPGMSNLDLTNWFGMRSYNNNNKSTAIDFSNATASTITANHFFCLTTVNFSGMTNLASVNMNGGKIDFSGGAEGAWYSSFSGTKNISSQRPEVALKKDYPPLTLGFNSTFMAPAPVWLTASYHTDIATIISAPWIDNHYMSDLLNRDYTLAYTDPDGNSEDHLDTAKPGIHTVTYSFTDYPGENYSRQYLVSTPDFSITKTHVGAFTHGQIGATYTITVTNYGISPSSGTVTVIDTLPSGLIATGFSGAGWTCDLATLTATRSDILAVNQSFPVLTLTVNVANNAPMSVTNTATVYYGPGNILSTTTNDPTTILDTTPPVITIIKPINGATVNINTGSLVIVSFADNCGIDQSSLQVKIDDGDWTANNLTGPTLYYLFKLPLTDGTHTLSFKVKDIHGNETIQPVSFTWDNYRRGFGFGRFSF